MGYDNNIDAGFIRAYQTSTGLKPLLLNPQGGFVGIGTTSPGHALDVQGGQINASGGLCIAGVCQTSWPAAATLGSNTFAGNQTLTSGNLTVGSGSINTNSDGSANGSFNGIPVSAAIAGTNNTSSSTEFTIGVTGVANDPNPQGNGGIGVVGISANTTGQGTGAVGIAYSPSAVGLVANHQSPTGLAFSVQTGPHFNYAMNVYGDGAAGMGKVAIGSSIGFGNGGFSTLTARAEPQFQATGMVSVTAGSNVVAGIGTQFTSEFGANDRVTINGQTVLVTGVPTDTSMTVNAPFNASASNVPATNFPNVFRVDDVNGVAQFAVSWDGFTTVGGPGHLSKFQVEGAESTPNGRGSAMQIGNFATGGNAWVLRSGATGTITPPGGFSISDGGNNYRMVIDSAGKVGIGATGPTQQLEVNGGVRLNTATAQPACDATVRGTFWVAQGGAGVKDSVQVCAKDASDLYAWRTIF
jgi:hypothetical protein